MFVYFYRIWLAIVAGYIATILSGMCMDYVSLAWLDPIPHIRALLQVIIALHGKGVWPRECGITLCSICQCLNHWKIVIIIWLFNCLIALEAKCHLCKGTDFIVSFMTCLVKHINTTMQVFTRITESICSCLVISLYSSFKVNLCIMS